MDPTFSPQALSFSCALRFGPPVVYGRVFANSKYSKQRHTPATVAPVGLDKILGQVADIGITSRASITNHGWHSAVVHIEYA